jgi:hypothetical protein
VPLDDASQLEGAEQKAAFVFATSDWYWACALLLIAALGQLAAPGTQKSPSAMAMQSVSASQDWS